MEQVWENMDLRRLIYSFGYPQHRNHMNHIARYFRQKKRNTQFNIRCLRRDFALYNSDHHYISSLDQMLPDLLTFEEQYYLLNQMMDCRCCTRHSYGKPVRSMLWIEENMGRGDNVECSCWCRHMSRILNYSIHHYTPTLTCRENPQYITPHEMY